MAAGPVYSKENEQRIKIFLSWSGDKSKKLANVANAFDIKVDKEHRGLADCYTIKAVYEVLSQKVLVKTK